MQNNQILTDKQTLFLKKIGQNDFFKDNYYLTGGTALSAFYLRHRYSEDLDFFSEKDIDMLQINSFIKTIKNELGISKIDFQQSYNRNLYFLQYNDGEILKTEFTFYPFTQIEKPRIEYGVKIDSLLDIGVNKLFTIYQRSQIKDYIDLYFISKNQNLAVSDLIKKARIKFDFNIDPMQLGTQFIKIRELKDLPNMIEKTELDDIYNFFTEEAKNLRPEVIT